MSYNEKRAGSLKQMMAHAITLCSEETMNDFANNFLFYIGGLGSSHIMKILLRMSILPSHDHITKWTIQQYNVPPYFYAVHCLRPATQLFLLAKKFKLTSQDNGNNDVLNNDVRNNDVRNTATRGVATGGNGGVRTPPTFVLDKFFNSFKTG